MTETVESVTCLGCGCACDDIDVAVERGRIVDARNACELGRDWFGNGDVPSRIHVNGRDASLADAMAAAVGMLNGSRRPFVYLAPDVSCETQRQAAGLADLLRARLDSPTSAAAAFILAAQELGFASSTLGEIRNRADVLVVWAADLAGRYPRFTSRYAPGPVGTHLPDGRRSRSVIGVDVGRCTATLDADRRITVNPADEIAVLTALEAFVRTTANAPGLRSSASAGAWETARTLAPTLLDARYLAIAYDAEPDDRDTRSPLRFAAITSLSQTLNARTRCAAIAMRAGGNRSGADAVLVAQTGFPFAVDFSRGYPRYDPADGSAESLVRDRTIDLALIVGNGTAVTAGMLAILRTVPAIVIGPRATQITLGARSVAIDTGVDGIHAGGTALRADDVPLPLTALIPGRPRAEETLRALTIATRQA